MPPVTVSFAPAFFSRYGSSVEMSTLRKVVRVCESFVAITIQPPKLTAPVCDGPLIDPVIDSIVRSVSAGRWM